jgi:hypothetical protein
MRNRIFGAIGLVWGGAILARTYFAGGPAGAGAYRQGQMVGVAFGALFAIVGAYYLFKGDGSKRS